MGILSWLKTSEKAVDTAADLVKDGAAALDMMFYTDEEKSISAQKMIDTWIEMQNAMHQENSAKSITRRYLALMILGSFLAQAFIAIGLFRYDPEWSKFVLSIMGLQSFMVGSVTIFYFGYYGIKQILGKKK